MYMKKIKRIFLLNRSFFTGALVFLVVGLLFLLFSSRANGFLYLNPYHQPFLNSFFIYFTNLGNGFFPIAIAVIYLVLRRYKMTMQIIFSFLVSGLFTQLLKRFIFSPRPKDFFGIRENIFIIKDVTLGGGASFPSGHTATAFALATSLALYSKNKKTGWVYIVFAALVGYSRIYLSQHFPRDVFAGAIIGIGVALSTYIIIESNPAYDSK